VRKSIFILLCVLICTFYAGAENTSSPVIKELSPPEAQVNEKITIKGSNFSPEKDKNSVFFGSQKAQVIEASSESLVVTVPEIKKGCGVSVEVKGQKSQEVAFRLLPYLEFMLSDKNITAGKKTIGIIKVRGSKKPWKIRVINKYYEVIDLIGGNEQDVVTSGGDDNKVELEIMAKQKGNFSLMCKKLEELDGTTGAVTSSQKNPSLALEPSNTTTPPEDKDVATTPPEDKDVATTPPKDKDVATTPPKDKDVATTPPKDSDKQKVTIPTAKQDKTEVLAYCSKIQEKLTLKKGELDKLQKQIENKYFEYGKKISTESLKTKEKTSDINARGKRITSRLQEIGKELEELKDNPEDNKTKIESLRNERNKLYKEQKNLRAWKKDLGTPSSKGAASLKEELKKLSGKRDQLKVEIDRLQKDYDNKLKSLLGTLPVNDR